MTALLRGTCCALLLLVACGGKKPVEAPRTSDVESGPDAGTSDPTGTGSASSAADASSSSATSAHEAASAPAPLSCTALGSCTEITLGGKEAADAKDRCKAASGEARDGACSHDGVLATCALPAKGAILYHYKSSDPEETRGRLKGGESACKAAGGTFALAAKPAAGKPAAGKPAAKPKAPTKKP